LGGGLRRSGDDGGEGRSGRMHGLNMCADCMALF
jgi:hypothetical protein